MHNCITKALGCPIIGDLCILCVNYLLSAQLFPVPSKIPMTSRTIPVMCHGKQTHHTIMIVKFYKTHQLGKCRKWYQFYVIRCLDSIEARFIL